MGEAGVEAVSWEVVGDIDSHPAARQVVDILLILAAEHQSDSGNTMVVLLEGQDQRPIIRVRTRGLGAFMALVGELQDLGLTDRLEEEDGPEQGVDAAFT